MTLLKLTRYELKKLFIKKSIIYIILFMLLLSFGSLFRQYLINYRGNYHGIQGGSDIYAAYGGEITEEKLETLEKLYKHAQKVLGSHDYETTYQPDKYYSGYEYGEANLTIELYENALRVLEYGEYIEQIKYETKEFLDENPELDSYIKSYNQLIYDTFGERSLNEIAYHNHFSDYFTHNFTNLLVLLIVIVGAMTIFTADASCGCKDYLSTALYGSKLTITAKLVAAAVFTAVVMLIFYSADLIYFISVCRLSGFDLPLYYLPEYANTTINLTIWQYLLLVLFIRFIGFMTIALVCAIAAHISQKPVFSFFVTIVFMVSVMLSRYLTVAENLSFVNCWNPISLLICHDLFKGFNVVNFFGIPVQTYLLTIICVTVVDIILICALYVSESVLSKKGRIKNA